MDKHFISIIIPTFGRQSLYALVENLLKQNILFDYEILLITQASLKKRLLKDKKIKIIRRGAGKGFSYYRNEGIKVSSGDLIVFIDDDELPINTNWLSAITKPITGNKELVVTSGIKITLGQGYLADSISLAGFPGGGAIGFEAIWSVNNMGYTNHICSGNMSIKKSVLQMVNNFDNSLTYGGEDVLLAYKIMAHNIKIKYEKNATVYHRARSNLIDFIKWNILAGKSVLQLQHIAKNVHSYIPQRIKASVTILKHTIKTKYFIMVIIVLCNQYFWQSIGYLIQNIKCIIEKSIYETNS